MGKAGVQMTHHVDQVVMMGRAVAQQNDIDRGRTQGVQTIGKFAWAASNFHAGLPAQGTAQQLGLSLIGIGQQNTDGLASLSAWEFHDYSLRARFRGEA